MKWKLDKVSNHQRLMKLIFMYQKRGLNTLMALSVCAISRWFKCFKESFGNWGFALNVAQSEREDLINWTQLVRVGKSRWNLSTDHLPTLDLHAEQVN